MATNASKLLLTLALVLAMQAAESAMWVKSRQFTGRIVTVSNSRVFDDPACNFTRDFPSSAPQPSVSSSRCQMTTRSVSADRGWSTAWTDDAG